MLQGFAIGSAARWRSAPVIGFASIAYTNTVYDLNRQFKGNETWNLDSWLEYNRVIRLGGKKIGWTVQGRVQNLLGDRDTVPWTAYDNGSGGAYIARRLAPRDRQFVLDTRLSF